MKSILKTVLGLVAASVAAVAVLAFSAFAAVGSVNSTDEEDVFKWDSTTKMWQGRFYNKDVAKFDKEFFDPESFRFHIKGDSLTLTGEWSFLRNFKTAVITLKSKSGIESKSTPYEDHNYYETTVKADYTNPLYYGQYFGFMYKKTTIDDGMYEKAAVYVAQTGYMPLSGTNLIE